MSTTSQYGKIGDKANKAIDDWHKDVDNLNSITGAGGQVEADKAAFAAVLATFKTLFDQMKAATDIRKKFQLGQQAYAIAGTSLFASHSDAQSDDILVLGAKLKVLADYQNMTALIKSGVEEVNNMPLDKDGINVAPYGNNPGWGNIHNLFLGAGSVVAPDLAGFQGDMEGIVKLIDALKTAGEFDKWTDSGTMSQLETYANSLSDALITGGNPYTDPSDPYLQGAMEVWYNLVNMWWVFGRDYGSGGVFTADGKQNYTNSNQVIDPRLDKIEKDSNQISTTLGGVNSQAQTELQYVQGLVKQILSTLQSIEKDLQDGIKDKTSKRPN